MLVFVRREAAHSDIWDLAKAKTLVNTDTEQTAGHNMHHREIPIADVLRFYLSRAITAASNWRQRHRLDHL